MVISSSAKLDYHMGYMVVRKDEEIKIHISEISILIIESTAVSLTAALLSELTKKKIKVIFCDEKRNPSSELVPYYGAHDTSEKIRRQMAWTSDVKSIIWTEIVREKILKQAVPDEDFVPSRLYKKLMELPWCDVFTTNYDTLLERTADLPRYILMLCSAKILQEQKKTV